MSQDISAENPEREIASVKYIKQKLNFTTKMKNGRNFLYLIWLSLRKEIFTRNWTKLKKKHWIITEYVNIQMHEETTTTTTTVIIIIIIIIIIITLLLLLLLLLFYSLQVFPTSFIWCYFTGVWVTASFFRSPGLFLVFWPISTM